jgi:hypothetical protein
MSEWFGSANLIVHQGIMDIFYQIIESPCILGINEESRKILSGCD